MEAAMNLFSSSPTPFHPPRSPLPHIRNSFYASSSVSVLHEQAGAASVSSLPSATISRHFPASILLQEQRDEFQPYFDITEGDGASQMTSNSRVMNKTEPLDDEEINLSSSHSLSNNEHLLLDWQNLSFLFPSLSRKETSSTVQQDATHLDQVLNIGPSDVVSLAKKALSASKEAVSLVEGLDETLSSRSIGTSSVPEEKRVRSTRLLERRSKKRKATKPRLSPETKTFQRSDIRRKSGEAYDPNDPLRLFLWSPETRQLLTIAEEVKLIDQIQEFKKLMEVKRKLHCQFDREPSLVEWADAAGLSHSALKLQLQISNRSREKLITANFRMVVHIAKQYLGKGLSLQDLLQEGSMGLMKSVEKFKPQAGCRFPSYAYWWIRQSVRKALFQHSRTIRLPENVYGIMGKVMEAKKSYMREGNRNPTHEQLAQRVGIKVDKLKSLLYLTRIPVSMQKPVWTDQDISFQEITADTEIESPAKSVSKQLMRQHVRNLVIASLTEKERRIIKLRFGIGCSKQNSLSEIGNMLGMSKERVRQLEERALQKLKESLGTQGLEEYVDLLV